MSELLTAAAMRALETAAIKSGTVTGRALMERAGAGVVEAVLAHWPGLGAAPRRALVLCGPGNNGGDGFVIARLLRDRGWEVDLALLGKAEKLPPDARANADRWRALGRTRPFGDLDAALADEAGTGALDFDDPPDLIVDALFGTGLARPLGSDVARVLAGIGERAARPPVISRVVAVDVPSGLCSDSGRDLGGAVRCDLTVTFHRARPGHYLAQGPDRCGALVVKDIGLPHGPADGEGGAMRLAEPSPRLNKTAGHKYDHGHALILAGGGGRCGAARLAARGALRIGAGLVTLAPTPGAMQENAARLDAVMLQAVPDGEALAALMEDERLNTLALGPGLGAERARDLVPVALAAGRPVVLDADALTAFADDPDGLFRGLHEGCVLTPHGGEFARLFGDLATRLGDVPDRGPAYSKADAAREAAARAGCTVLFKGADTVIAAPDGRCAIHSAHYERTAPWLATAGSGDVLAGFIAGLLARRLPVFEAAATAAWLHVECARAFGPGLISEDLPEALPRALHGLGA